MYICYLDESGSLDLSSGTSHFALVGLAIPHDTWQAKDRDVVSVKTPYGLQDDEIHTGWMTRRYVEQEKIAGFASMPREQRRVEVLRERRNTLIRIAATKPQKALAEAKKNSRKTTPYVHLTRDERIGVIQRIADLVGSWDDCRVFFEVASKSAFRGGRTPPIEEESFTQVVSRFQHFLRNRGVALGGRIHGLLVQDNNETVSRRFTNLMRVFHRQGTSYTLIPDIVETPLFVDSELTSMVQVADVCAYAVRRFVENNEVDLFDRVYPRVDRRGSVVVGGRHFTGATACHCRVCVDHGRWGSLGFPVP